MNINFSTYLNKIIFTACIKDISNLESWENKERYSTIFKQCNINLEEIFDIDCSNFTLVELKIINLIKEGKTSQDIAKLINFSISTINSYRSAIKKKLGVDKKKIKLKKILDLMSK